MAGENQTVSEYIVHHLTNLTYGKLPAGYERYDGSIVGDGGAWVMAHGGAEAADMGFTAIHVDSMAWSIGLGIVFSWLFYSVAKKASSGVPSGLGSAVGEVLARNALPTKFSIHGLPDETLTVGMPDELYVHYGLTIEETARRMRVLLAGKC